MQPSRNSPAAWPHFIARHNVGDETDGTVTTLVRFGAFVEVEDGIEGLVHTSDMPRPLEPGERLRVRITSMDDASRRMNLQPA